MGEGYCLGSREKGQEFRILDLGTMEIRKGWRVVGEIPINLYVTCNTYNCYIV